MSCRIWTVTTGDRELDLDKEVVEAPELVDETALQSFAKFLSEAQEAARLAERQRDKASKRPKHYSKNSKKTQYRNRVRSKEMEAKGFKSKLPPPETVHQLVPQEADTDSDALACLPTPSTIHLDILFCHSNVYGVAVLQTALQGGPLMLRSNLLDDSCWAMPCCRGP
ncbi:hypothetical protein B0H10DRAFT_2448719 [Mycena sp. CBHHK59/15]|nr:hypothetical protein B0H10DRAFT_2448719 [Mycena sp. CBHHK59/15]